jgi:hypothetical protein
MPARLRTSLSLACASAPPSAVALAELTSGSGGHRKRRNRTGSV